MMRRILAAAALLLAALVSFQPQAQRISYGPGMTPSASNPVLPDALNNLGGGVPLASGVTCTTSNGAATVTGCNSTVGLAVGMVVTGPGIAAGTTIASGITATGFTMSANAGAGAGAGLVTVRHQPFWSDVDGGTPAIIRHPGRLMVGGAVGTLTTRAGTQLTICPTDTPCGKYGTGRDSQLGVVSTRGGLAITGMSRASDGSDVSPMVPIGVGGFVVVDAARTGWAIYGDVIYSTAGNLGFGAEFAIKNTSPTNATSTPYGGQQAAPRGVRVFGGDNAYGGTATNPNDVAYEVIKGGSAFNTGLLFYKDALEGTDGVTGFGTAIRMAKGHNLRWDEPAGGVGFQLRSDVATAGDNVSLVAEDNALTVFGSGGVAAARFYHTDGITTAARLAMRDAATGVAPQLLAEGTDTNIDVHFVPKGTGVAKVTGSFQTSAVTSAPTLATDSNGKIAAATISATAQSSPSDPTGTNSATRLMMGLAGSITPASTGKVMCTISGTARNTVGGATNTTVSAHYGTGTAPTNGAALTGTQFGTTQILVPSGAGERVGFSTQGIISATLSLGTAHWIDAALASSAGTSTIANISISCHEIR